MILGPFDDTFGASGARRYEMRRDETMARKHGRDAFGCVFADVDLITTNSLTGSL